MVSPPYGHYYRYSSGRGALPVVLSANPEGMTDPDTRWKIPCKGGFSDLKAAFLPIAGVFVYKCSSTTMAGYWCGKSPDPKFAEKQSAIVGLYLDLPDNAVVLCVDEKSQLQALDRTKA
jgi:hypothetical protein